MPFNVLFYNDRPKKPEAIREAIENFPKSYDKVVRHVIENNAELNEESFKKNVITLLKNFKMTRRGVFNGIDITNNDMIIDPNNVIQQCWNMIHDELEIARELLQEQNIPQRTRILLLLRQNVKEHIINLLWRALKNLLKITMTKDSYGLVGASKILFAVFPEIALPVDNREWKQLFRTVDYGDILRLMTEEIKNWEMTTAQQLENCDIRQTLTLPAIYNVMAMEVRP